VQASFDLDETRIVSRRGEDPPDLGVLLKPGSIIFHDEEGQASASACFVLQRTRTPSARLAQASVVELLPASSEWSVRFEATGVVRTVDRETVGRKFRCFGDADPVSRAHVGRSCLVCLCTSMRASSLVRRANPTYSTRATAISLNGIVGRDKMRKAIV
jgi:hypothetical protein